MNDEPEIVKELKEWEKNHTSRNCYDKYTNKHRPSSKLFEDASRIGISWNVLFGEEELGQKIRENGEIDNEG